MLKPDETIKIYHCHCHCHCLVGTVEGSVVSMLTPTARGSKWGEQVLLKCIPLVPEQPEIVAYPMLTSVFYIR